MRLRYLTPFAFLALLPLGGWLGGAWTFIGVAATPLILVGLDGALGQEGPQALPSRSLSSRWLPRAYILLQLAVTIWAVGKIARGGTTLIEAIGLALSAAIAVGSMWIGLLVSYVHGSIPASFSIMAVATAAFAMTFVPRRRRPEIVSR